MLEQALNRTAITQNGFMLLLSGDNTVLSSENGAGQNLPEDIGASLSQSAQDTWNTIELDGIPCYTYSATLPPTGWTLVSVVPYTDIYSVGRALRNEMIGMHGGGCRGCLRRCTLFEQPYAPPYMAAVGNNAKVEDGDVRSVSTAREKMKSDSSFCISTI